MKRHIEEILIEHGHKKQRALVCPQCQKAFGTKGHLTNHIRIVHEKRKDHACPHCEKAFGQKAHLTAQR